MADLPRFTYPDDVDYGYQIQGLYDGTCVWFLKDGRILNRFQGEGSVREERTAAWIRENYHREADQ